MKLIIDIPESRYRLLQKQAKTNLGREKLDEFAEVVLNGTPLPKGHGRLIDADKVISDGIDKGFCDWYDELKYADTIIEADKNRK